MISFLLIGLSIAGLVIACYGASRRDMKRYCTGTAIASVSAILAILRLCGVI